jgi:hypothetical protein
VALIRLIDVSSAVEELEDAELDRILDSPVRHNTPQQVTGLLLYSEGGFMQVLESEQPAVDETFSRIRQDSRHHNIIVLNMDPIDEREFSAWSMGFRRLTEEDGDSLPGFEPFFSRGFDATKLSAHPGVGLELLRHFR